jgi:hypothetical protein
MAAWVKPLAQMGKPSAAKTTREEMDRTISFTPIALTHLKDLAQKTGESYSHVVRMALRRMHREEFPAQPLGSGS